jgi:23S rRNA pseudouridine1911/1915/1917 synthase
MTNVLYKNNQLIAFDKPAGIAVQADKTGDKPFIELAEIYCKHTLQLVHRIDRPVTGVVLFAKSKAGLTEMSKQFEARTVEKEYLAVVKEMPKKLEDTLVHFLKKNEVKNTSHAFDTEQPGTERAELSYRWLASSENYHLLLIQLHTGRHHQIRSQLAAIGCPIKGDVKYGFKRGNKDRSIHLHAWKLAFDHPVNGQRVKITAPIPKDAIWNAFEKTMFVNGDM